MKFKASLSKTKKILCIAALLIFIFTQKVFSLTLDQNQPQWNGGTSERNLPGYYEWQSFTAGISGSLSKIDLMFCNTNVKVNGTGTLKVYTGQGTTGTLLLTQSVSVNGTAYNFNQPFWQSWNLNTTPNITVGSLYTFQFIPTQGGGLTDPYLIQIYLPSIYAGGQNYNLGTLGDCTFRTYVNTSLPVELISFSATLNKNKVELKWVTASEINNDYFNVERSSDTDTYISIGKVKGGGNSSHVLSYSCEDVDPAAGINYYRLKQVDYNGDYKFSEVISLNNKSKNNYCWTYTSADGVNFILRCDEHQNGIVSVFDMNGKNIEEKKFAQTSIELKINLSNYATGFYMLRFSDGEIIQNIKLTKK